jgi:hypothetical protein
MVALKSLLRAVNRARLSHSRGRGSGKHDFIENATNRKLNFIPPPTVGRAARFMAGMRFPA